MSKAVPRAVGVQSGARSPLYPLVHSSSMLEQLADEEQRKVPLALEAQLVATRPMDPECPAPVGWDIVV